MIILGFPALIQHKILKLVDFPDLIRFANCSSKTAKLVRNANISFYTLSFGIKEKSVLIWIKNQVEGGPGFYFVVDEKDYDGEEGLEWNGLGGLKFFECPVIGETCHDPEGPAEDAGENADNEEDVDADQNLDDGADQIFDDDEELEDEFIEDEAVNNEDGLNDEQDADADQDADGADGADENPEEDPEEDPEEELEVDAEPVSQDWYCKVSSPPNQSVFVVADLLITHFLDLFKRFERTRLVLRPTEASKQLIENHEKIRKCNGFGMVDFWRHNNYRPVTKELMEWSIDVIEASDHTEYFCDVIGELTCEKGFKSDKMAVYDGHWVHQNSIVDSESKEILIYKHIPSSTYMNAILKKWVSNEKMKNLRKIKWKASQTRLDEITDQFQEEVMDGIPEVILTDEEREAIDPEIDENHGSADTVTLKFFRRIDGKLAVVFVNSERFSYVFLSF